MPQYKFEFNASGVLPGEALLVAIFQYAKEVRQTMSQENRDRFDAVNVQVLEDWRKIWVKMGLLE